MPDENADKKPPSSLRRTLLLTALTAGVSGTVGAGITWFVQRARPKVSLVSVGFRGPINATGIDIGSELVALTSSTGMIKELQRYESFEKLAATEMSAGEALVQLNQSIAAVEAWRRRHQVPPQPEQLQRISKQAVVDHPYISDELVAGTLVALIRHGALLPPPHNLEVVSGLTAVLPFGEVSQGEWTLVIDKRVHKINTKEMLPDGRKAIQLLLASFSVGLYDNIEYYSSKFIEESRREIEIVRQISDGIRAILLPNAVISTTVMLENRGEQSVTFTPNFALHFQDSQLSLAPIVLRAARSRREGGSNPFRLTAGGFGIDIDRDQQDGKQVQVAPYLPDPDAFPYINIPGGESREISLTGVAPLGKATSDLLTLYKSKLLRFMIVGLTVTGVRVSSDIATFSEKVAEEEKKLLELR